ncbi:hypothetical protein N9W89_05085 [Hellea sp.]|nr:hypothetical protein [Hellea sp.]
MMRPIYALSLSAIYCASLAACTTVPKADTLTAGIPANTASKPANGQLRSESDPVCQRFYTNAKTYIAQAKKPSPGGQFMKRVAIGTVAGVAASNIGSTGSQVGTIAARRATSTAVSQGSNIALDGIKIDSGASKQLEATAAELACPVTFTI